MFCRNCGKELQAGDAFCPECGTRVEPLDSESAKTKRFEQLERNGFAVGGGESESGKAASQAGPQGVPPTIPQGFPPSGGQDSAQAQQAGQPANIASGLWADPQASPQQAKQASGVNWRVVAIVAICGVVLLAIIAVCVLMLGGRHDASQPAPASESAQEASGAAQGKTALNMFISQIDNASFPQMTMYVRLADQAGSEVAGIDAAQFNVVELGSDGAEHQATVNEILPVGEGDMMSINLVVDQSGSMSSEGKMGNAKAAAHAFIDEITASGTNNAEITSFDDRVYNRQPFTSNAVLLDSAVDALSTDGDTALYDALYWALQRTNLKSGSRVVIAFTDGEENTSSYSESDVVELSRLTGIPVYLVGIGDEVDAASLRSLATSCNGQYYDASTADLAQALQGIYESIYADQRSMYRVVYTSTFEGETSAYRTIRLVCTDSSAFQGAAESSYMPVDNVSAYESSVNMNDYVLEDSNRRYLAKSELEDMSLWELYLARNEIFARHGRGFKNQDLVDYFATRSWYTQRYTPEEFDAMPTPLNDYELKNVEAMYEIESARNSPYLVTAD